MKRRPKRKRLWKPAVMILAVMAFDLWLIFQPRDVVLVPATPEVWVVEQRLE